jgi:tetratricopeptide (TPR) repeat protein
MTSVRFQRLAVLVIASSLVSCGGPEARKAAYFAKGQEYLAAHNFAKARLEFRNALQVDPNDAEASFLAGRAAAELGNVREAAQMFQGAIQANPRHLGARAQLALLYAYRGGPDKAIELVEAGLAIAPDDPDLLTARGAARLKLGEAVAARADAERAAHIAPTNENAVVLLAGIYQQAGESQRAVDLVSNAVQAPAADVSLRQILAQLYLSTNRHPEAVQELQRVVAAEPDQLAHRYQLAEVLLQDKNVDAAEGALRAAVARAPTSAEAKLVLANMLASNRSYEVAEAELRRMSASSPDDYQLRLGLGQFYAIRNKMPQAEAIYRQVIKDDGTGPNGLTARNRLASVYLYSNRLDAAAPLIHEVLKKNPRDNDALFARASLSLSRGNADAAIADLRAVQRDQPNSVRLQRALAQAYLQNEDPTLAEETLRGAVQGSPTDVDARLELARLLARTGRVDAAFSMLERLAAEQPTNLAALRALFEAQVARKDFAGARRSARLVQTATPELAAGNYMSGLAETADGKSDAARAAFERAVAIAPDAIEPVSALVRLDLMQKRPDQAIARLDKLITQVPGSSPLRNLKGEVLASLNRADAAIGSFREAIALSPSWAMPYHSMALAEAAANGNDDAIKTLQKGIEASNGAPLLVTDLAGFYERRGRVDEAIAQYEGLLKRDADSPVAANNLALLLVTYRSDKSSLDRARALTERFANSRTASFLDTWGWVLYKRGEYPESMNPLQKAVDRAPHAPELRYHLAMAQLKSGARDSARSSLEQALKSNVAFSGSDEARKALGELQR